MSITQVHIELKTCANYFPYIYFDKNNYEELIQKQDVMTGDVNFIKQARLRSLLKTHHIVWKTFFYIMTLRGMTPNTNALEML